MNANFASNLAISFNSLVAKPFNLLKTSSTGQISFEVLFFLQSIHSNVRRIYERES